MATTIYTENNAKKEVEAFPKPAQLVFSGLLEVLTKRGRLDFPEGKKVTRELFEMRFVQVVQYRVLYAYIGKNSILLLSAFIKKTQKTPQKEIDKAKTRLRKHT